MTGRILILICLILLITAAFFFRKRVISRLNETLRRIASITAIFIIVACILLTGYILFSTNSNSVWYIDYIDYSGVHKYSTGSSQTIVLIDSGVSYELHDQIQESINLTDGSDYDVNGHGTMMLSILKGVKGKIEGIAPNVSVISMKVVDDTGKTEKEIMLKALEKVMTLKKVDIVNLSIGNYAYDDEIAAAIDKITNKGIVVVASSGDYQTDAMLFPASMDGVISVGALSANGKAWDYTNAPKDCDILAPGDEISVLTLDGKEELTSGTSQATILISGYIALLKDYAEQKQQNMNYKDIVAVLHEIQNANVSYTEVFENFFLG